MRGHIPLKHQLTLMDYMVFIIIIIITGTTALCGPWPSSELFAILLHSTLHSSSSLYPRFYVLPHSFFPSQSWSSHFPISFWFSVKYFLNCSILASAYYVYYIPENRTLHNHQSENLNPTDIMLVNHLFSVTINNV
jgi:hypothetical protein